MTDHERADDEIDRLASAAGLTVTRYLNARSVARLTGVTFDRAKALLDAEHGHVGLAIRAARSTLLK